MTQWRYLFIQCCLKHVRRRPDWLPLSTTDEYPSRPQVSRRSCRSDCRCLQSLLALSIGAAEASHSLLLDALAPNILLLRILLSSTDAFGRGTPEIQGPTRLGKQDLGSVCGCAGCRLLEDQRLASDMNEIAVLLCLLLCLNSTRDA